MILPMAVPQNQDQTGFICRQILGKGKNPPGASVARISAGCFFAGFAPTLRKEGDLVSALSSRPL